MNFLKIIFLLCSINVYAAENEEPSTTDKILEKTKEGWDKAVDYGSKKVEEMKQAKTSRENRGIDPFNINYAPVTFGLYYPIKSSWIAEYAFNEDHSIGAEYLSGGFSFKLSKIDLAEFKESLILVPFKYYWGSNSFFLKYGFGIRKYKIHIGDDFIQRISEASESDKVYAFDVLEVKNEVINLGLGNQWQWESGFNMGVEWFELFIPLGKGDSKEGLSPYLKEEDQKNWEKLINTLETKPSFNVFKIRLGWAF